MKGLPLPTFMGVEKASCGIEVLKHLRGFAYLLQLREAMRELVHVQGGTVA